MATKTSEQKQQEIEQYWARRNRELEAEWHRKCQQEIEKELAAYYRQALAHINDDIAVLYARFAYQNELDMVAAQQMLQGDEFRVWRMDIAEYIQKIEATGDRELLRELNVLAMRSRITRLDKLKADTLLELSKLTQKAEDAIDRFLPSAYKDFYYHGLYEIGKKAQIAVPVAKLDKEKLENVTRIPWSGKNYSERIWHNNAELGKTIQQTMLTAMHRGSSLSDLSHYVADRMNVGIHNAERLVQTELNYVQNQAALDSIKDAGMKYFRFIATLDSRTTVICREHDGRTFAVDDADVGYNMPPLHPRCRSTISGSLRAFKDKPLGTRIARDPETGKTTQYVPAGMKYSYWYRKYVDPRAVKSGIIKADREVSGHSSAPPNAGPYDVIDHKNRDGIVDKRTFYDNTGKAYLEINTTDHNQPKHHPYGKHGEHAHDIQWSRDGKVQRSTRDLLDFERKDNGDIL